MYFRLLDLRRPLEKIEVATFVRLRHVAGVEMTEASRVGHLARLPAGPPSCQLVVSDAKREAAAWHVELDEVTVAHERQRPAGE